MAISRDFLDIVLPNPVLSEAADDDFTGRLIPTSDTCETFRGSGVSATCPLLCTRPFPDGSVSLPLVTIGDECLLGAFKEPMVSGFPFIAEETPVLDLPAESGLPCKVVLRFGGVCRGKSGGITGCCGGRTRGLGELGRDAGPGMRPFERTRPAEVEGLDAADEEGAGFRRVGVDGREFDRVGAALKFAGLCPLELGVEGLEFWEGGVLSTDELVGAGRTLDGVEERDGVGRAGGVEGLATGGVRVIGEDGLV